MIAPNYFEGKNMCDIKIEYELIDDQKLTWYLVHDDKEDEVITDEDMVITDANGNQVPYQTWCDVTHMENATIEFRGEKYRVNGYCACFLGRIDTITIWLSQPRKRPR